jgi:hypothetical protein
MSNPPPQEPTLTLSISGERDPVPVRAALDPESSHFETLLTAVRGMSGKERTGISLALELVEIEETAKEILNKIRDKLDTSVKSWDLEPYHQGRLRVPGEDLHTPDCFFSRHASTKPRVILRLTSKEILVRVKRLPTEYRKKVISIFDTLPLHRQINDWIERWDRVAGEALRQEAHQEGDRRKRQCGK